MGLMKVILGSNNNSTDTSLPMTWFGKTHLCAHSFFAHPRSDLLSFPRFWRPQKKLTAFSQKMTFERHKIENELDWKVFVSSKCFTRSTHRLYLKSKPFYMYMVSEFKITFNVILKKGWSHLQIRNKKFLIVFV